MVYIKYVVLNCFRSYRDQRELVTSKQFSEKTNAIVGLNGSGKSNFFYAIRFVCDMFENLHADQRKKLLHEGYGTTILSGFVEICFDNSDRRFPFESDEVFIRRSIGLKKDEFFLNSKHATKQDVINFLESAGFSRSNPYYIVQQGKVDELTNMSEANRLDLLKEVAGTRVYDEKRFESEKIMRETNAKLREVDHVLSHIENRLDELRDEQEELVKFEELDRKKRALEYAFYSKELEDVVSKIVKITEKEEDVDRNASTRILVQLESILKQNERQLKSLNEKIQNLSDEQVFLSGEKKRLRESSAKSELSIFEGKENERTVSDRQSELREKLTEVSQEIEAKKILLAKLKPKYMELMEAERESKERLSSRQQRRQNLYGKQGRTKQFTSKKDRDQWIRTEMEDLQRSMNEKKNQISELQLENSHLLERIHVLAARHEELTKESAKKEDVLETISFTLKEKENQRHECANQRSAYWRREDELNRKIDDCTSRLGDSERRLRSCTKKVVWEGIRLVQQYAKSKNLSGVYGPLIELFSCAPECHNAVEAAGKASLFHVVVDTDETASKLLRVLNKERVGRVTFIPLNQLRPKVGAVTQAGDVGSLISKAELRYDPAVEKAIQQVFGRVLLCRNMEVACSYAGAEGLTCVTLDGDLVDRKGSMSGGFFDQDVSSLKSMALAKEARSELRELHDDFSKVKAAVQEADQSFTKVFSEIQKEQTRHAHLQNSVSHLLMEQRNVSSEKVMLEKHLEEKQLLLANASASLVQFQQMYDTAAAELKSPFTSNLSAAETKEVKSLEVEIEQLTEEEKAKSVERAQVEEQKNLLESTIFEKLMPQEDNFRKELSSLGNVESRELLMEENNLREITGSLSEVEDKAQQLEVDLESSKKELRSLESEIEKNRTEYESKLHEVQDESKSRERLLNRKKLLVQKRDDWMKKISELGPLPANEEFEGSVKELLSMLQKTNAELSKYKSVNKKAGDQYRTFQEQRTALLARKKSLDSGAVKIQELIDTLDQKKAEAIQRTFRGVAKNFQEVFSELVPTGCAKLIIKTEEVPVASSSSSSSASSSEETARVKMYSGVAIKVSFTSKNIQGSDAVLIHQLSGGQKSLVALALIFAIQRCDPAPFYILDEIDAALDPEYRTAVASMISKQAQVGRKESGEEAEGSRGPGAQPTQFIYASFGEELVEQAENHYCVSLLESKVSQLSKVAKAEALKVVRLNREREGEEQ